MRDVIVIGGGLGGLSAAVALAAKGYRVDVLEAADTWGGKASAVVLDGLSVDTGPSLLTLPDAVRDVLALAGPQFDAMLELRRLDPSFRYLWPDGTHVDMRHDPADAIASVRHSLGPAAGDEFARFLAYAKRIWETAETSFIRGEAPTLRSMIGLDWKSLATLRHLDGTSTMWGRVQSDVRNPYLRAILARYATYNGSDVRKAPATLHCIAHVELGLGGYGVVGGMQAIARALVAAGTHLGVTYRLGAAVDEIVQHGGHVSGVRLAGGDVLPARAVVSNADTRLLYTRLLPGRTPPAGDPSTSGWTAIARTSLANPKRAAHTVLFPRRPYVEEFADLFDRQRVPVDPTIYVCDQAQAHGVTWPDAAPVFAMVNAPALGQRNIVGEAGLPRLVRDRLADAGLIDQDARWLWERTVAGLATRFAGSDGALYGAASNSPLSAFRRPANRDPQLRGLYVASGSAHPGGGVPLVCMSGLAAARAVAVDFAPTPR